MKRTLVIAVGLIAISCGAPEEAALEADASDAPVRIQTSAGSFMVREAVADDFRELLAGRATQHVYFAEADTK